MALIVNDEQSGYFGLAFKLRVKWGAGPVPHIHITLREISQKFAQTEISHYIYSNHYCQQPTPKGLFPP